jgi:hypothetical protein
MTPAARSRWASAARFAATIAAALLTASFLGAWNLKESVSSHDRDVAAVRSELALDQVRDSAFQVRAIEMQITLFCELKPSSRRCK